MDAAATPDIAPGAVIADTYRIERVLGEGGMGLVYEAQHLRVPRRVAIKVLRSTPDPELLARFRQEAEVASRLHHPGIVDVIDFNTLPSGAAYLVMELLDGESLGSRLRARGKLPVDEAVPLLRQIASALHAAHCAGVVHRDLKPENVFLVKREHEGELVDDIKLLDFGISKVSGGSAVRTRDDVVLGTPRYMAPEQASGRSEVDPRADQFALGVMAYEMLTGQPPFDGDNGTVVMFKIVYEDPPLLGSLAADVPPRVIAAIERAMQKEPHRRFDDLSLFVEALSGKPLAATDRSSYPVLAPPPASASATVQSRPRAANRAEAATVQIGAAPRDRRRRWPIALGGAVAVAGIVVAVAVMPSRTSSTPARAADASISIVSIPPVAVDAQAVPVPADAAVATDAAPSPSPPIKPPTSHSPQSLSAEVRAELEECERLLRSGDLSEAETTAIRIVRDHPSVVRAAAILVEIACARHDLESAQARLRQLPRSAWAGVRAKCSGYGFDLVNPSDG